MNTATGTSPAGRLARTGDSGTGRGFPATLTAGAVSAGRARRVAMAGRSAAHNSESEEMEQKQTSSDQGGQRRRANRRRRRRRRSPATSHGPAPAAGSAPPEPAAAEVPAAAPPPARVPAPAPGAAAGPATDSRTCPLCARPVLDLYTAIAYGESQAPAHFDCIVSLLGEREEVAEGARLCYLGGGSFGIVQMRPAARPGDRALLIHRRIEVEDKDATPPWRAELRLPLTEPSVPVAAGEPVRSLGGMDDDQQRRTGPVGRPARSDQAAPCK